MMDEPLDIDRQLEGSLGDQSQHKPNLPTPKVPYADFLEAQQDDKVKQAIREALEESASLEQEGKIRL
jgi:hypothetical protein